MSNENSNVRFPFQQLLFSSASLNASRGGDHCISGCNPSGASVSTVTQAQGSSILLFPGVSFVLYMSILVYKDTLILAERDKSDIKIDGCEGFASFVDEICRNGAQPES